MGKVRGEGFEGKCYVFDERIGVEVNRTPGAKVIARCKWCQEPCDRQINCAYSRCNERHFCCSLCEDERDGYCESICLEARVAGELAVTGD
jgi:UPF0176 protein